MDGMPGVGGIRRSQMSVGIFVGNIVVISTDIPDMYFVP
jgi:hypothetical protein